MRLTLRYLRSQKIERKKIGHGLTGCGPCAGSARADLCDHEEKPAGEKAQMEKVLKDGTSTEIDYAYRPCAISFRRPFIQVPCHLQHTFDLLCNPIRKA